MLEQALEYKLHEGKEHFCLVFALCASCLVRYMALYGENIDPTSHKLEENNCIYRTKIIKKKIKYLLPWDLSSVGEVLYAFIEELVHTI